jgi:hypothetical protein
MSQKKMGKMNLWRKTMDKIIKVRQYSTVICDLDGTIADLTHRLHFIKNADGTKKKYKDADWDSFHKTCTDDLPITRNIMALESLAGGEEREVYFFSGRNEEVRKETIEWICKHVNINTPALWTENPYSVGLRLFMRKKNDRRLDTIVKLEMMQELGLKPRDVLVILDDRQCVVDMWRDNGFNCHQVNAWKENAPTELSSADRILRILTELPDFWEKESYNEDLL